MQELNRRIWLNEAQDWSSCRSPNPTGLYCRFNLILAVTRNSTFAYPVRYSYKRGARTPLFQPYQSSLPSGTLPLSKARLML
jgi:hypothetical protein